MKKRKKKVDLLLPFQGQCVGKEIFYSNQNIYERTKSAIDIERKAHSRDIDIINIEFIIDTVSLEHQYHEFESRNSTDLARNRSLQKVV